MYRNKRTGVLVGDNPAFASYPHLEKVEDLPTEEGSVEESELKAAVAEIDAVVAPTPAKPGRKTRSR